MSIFHLRFPKVQKNFTTGNITFSIGNIKSRHLSVGLFKLHCYNYQGQEILTSNKPLHVGKRFVITSSYHEYVEPIELTDAQISQTYEFEIELVLFGITSENPCWFNNLMLEVGNHEEYHKPNDSFEETDILFKNNNYAVLYSTNHHGLQVIKPNTDKITTKTLPKSEFTILAPHLDEEPVTDTPSKLMMEFINQTEQYISIKK